MTSRRLKTANKYDFGYGKFDKSRNGIWVESSRIVKRLDEAPMSTTLTGSDMVANWHVQMQPFRMGYCPANALWMARLSEAVYTQSTDGSPDVNSILGKLKNADDGFNEVVPFNASSSQACVIAHDDYIAAVFRGTDEIADWLDNLNVVPTSGPFGKVHKGFRNALMDVWPSMRQTIRTIRRRNGRRRPLWLTGHSLGGALATIAASLLVEDDEPFFGVYTFGSPRCGDKEFARVYKVEAGARTYRFQNNNDIVSRVPARAMGYRHVGNFVYIKEDGCLVNDVGFWYQFLDAIRGVVADIGTRGLDSIEDHRMRGYVQCISKWGNKKPEES